MAPNALPYPESIREPSAPAQLLWIQSDIAALTGSREPVVRAVEDFSRRHDLPVVLIGRNVLEKIPFRNAIEMGEIDLTSNLQLLEFAPTSIGVAPLETACDEATRDFIGGKSDLKMLLFGGYGHAGVYSNAAPYTDSGITAGRMTDNSYAAWTEALEHELRQGWRDAAGNGRRMRERRHIDVIARSCWRPALEAVRFNRPQRGADLYDCFMTFRNHRGAQVMAARQMLKEAGVRKWVLRPALRVIGRQAEVAPESPELLLRAIRAQTSHLLQLAGVPDPDSERLRAQINACERQLREVHESYSWKITAPLRVIAAPVMRRLAKRG